MLPLEGEGLAGRVGPHAVDDRELLLEHLEAVPGRRERDAERLVLAVVPARAQAELDPAAAHRVGLRDLDGENARQPEGHRRDERAEPDALGLATERRERQPGVGRPHTRRSLADAEVVIRPEERVESQRLGEPGKGEELVVRRSLLRLGEDPQPHAGKLPRAQSDTNPTIR